MYGQATRRHPRGRKLVEAAATSQSVAFVELRAGAPDAAEDVLRHGIAELDRLGNRELPRDDGAAARRSRWPPEARTRRPPRWCAEVRGTLNEDDLTDVIGIDAVEGFLAAVAGGARRGRAAL